MGYIYTIQLLKYSNYLEYNSIKNVSNWVTFLWQTQIQTIKYGLNDTKRIRKKLVTLILCSFTPSDRNFQTILMPKMILEKNFTKNQPTWAILILSMLKFCIGSISQIMHYKYA